MSMLIADGFDSAELRSILYDPDFCLETSCDLFFKSKVGGSTTVGVVTIEGKRYVVKRYNSKGLIRDFLSQFRMSRAKRNWKFALKLQSMGVPVVPPVALLEKWFGPIRMRTYFISEYLPGMEAAQYFSDDNTDQKHWGSAFKKIAKITQLLGKAKLRHRDFQPGNVLIVNHQPYLLDFDYMYKVNRSASSFAKIQRRQVGQFLNSLNHSSKAKALFEVELKAIGENI